jgi:predicted DNA-binding protein YlxM (UPF0122 family)
MSKTINIIMLLGTASFLLACTSTTQVSKGSKSSSYKEDLSAHRKDAIPLSLVEGADKKDIKTESLDHIKPVHDITANLNNKLDSIAKINAQNKFIQGYTIQVYTGNSREAATQAKEKVYQILTDASPELSYVQPNYRVKVGKFPYRLEAQQTYAELRKEFPNAMVIPERIRIDK